MTAPQPFTWTYTHTSTVFESAADAPEQPVHVLAGNAINPYMFHDSSQIPANTAYVFDTSGEMRLTGHARASLAYHWLREIALGVIEGELGLKIASGVDATLDLGVGGRFHAVISLDDARWLRLRIGKSHDTQLNLGAQVSARVTGCANVPEQSGELMAALVGVHQMQWLSQLTKLADRGALAAEAARMGVEAAPLKRALGAWRTLDATAAQAAWAALGTGVAPFASAEAADTLKRLKSYADVALNPAILEQTLNGDLAIADGWVRKQLGKFLGAGSERIDATSLADKMRAVRTLSDSILSRVPTALEKLCAADLSWRFEAASSDTALIDCSFAFTPEGLRLYQDALNGNYTRVLNATSDQVRLGAGVLTAGLHRETVIELHLPLVGRKRWKSRVEALSRVEVETGADGRILVYGAEAAGKLTRASAYQSALTLFGALKVGETYSDASFKLSYTDTQTFARADAAARLAPILAAYGFDDRVTGWLSESVPEDADRVESSLSLAVPGSLVTAWLKTPGERDPDFFAVFSRMSVAVQTAMRRWIPFGYFQNLNEYETLGSAFALLAYQTSKPFAGRPRSEFTYDVMEDRSMARVFRTAGKALPRVLESVSATLAASGREEAASFYAPHRAESILATVQRNPRMVRSLLVADAFYIGALVKLGLEGRRLASEFKNDPQKAVKDLSRFTAGFVRSYHGRMRRLYAGRNFPALGAMVLVEATAALAGATGMDAQVSAVLRLKAGSIEQTFVNPAYRG
jgi:hypothetical protein